MSYSNRPTPQQAYDYARSQQSQGNLQATFETLFDLQQVYPNFADVPAWLQFFQQQNYRYIGNTSLFRQVGVGSPVAATSGSPTQFQMFVPPPPPPPSPVQVSSKPASPNRAPLFTILGVIAAVIVVGGIVAIWLIQDGNSHSQATATAQAQALSTAQSATAVAQSQLTATAISQATVTAQSQQTATAQSLALATAQSQQTATAVSQATAQSQQTATAISQVTAQSQQTATARVGQAAATQTAISNQVNATATARGQSGNATATAIANLAATATAAARAPGGVPPLGQAGVKVFGPSSGDLKQADADHLATKSSNQDLHNFVVKASFGNPDNFSVPWDIGFVFRRSDTKQLRLIVVSDGHWEVTDGNGTSLSTGNLSGFNKATNGSNSLALFVKDSTAVFYFNDTKISTFDVGVNQDKGDIKVGADFFTEDSFVGRTTKFQDFTVWSSD